MKSLAIVFLLLATIPVGLLARSQSRLRRGLWLLLGLLPFIETMFPHAKFALISWADWSGFRNGWPGYSTGAEFTVMDLAAFAALFTLPRGADATPFRLQMGFYFFAVAISVLEAQYPIAALFYPWQLLRMFLVYFIVCRSCSDPRFIPTLQNALAGGLVVELLVVLWQKKTGTSIPPTGTFDHQNLLGMVAYFIALPMFARVLAGKGNWLLIAGISSCAVIISLTASRGALGLAAAGFILVFVLSGIKGLTTRKAAVALTSVIVLAVIVPVTLTSLHSRFAGGPASTGAPDERAQFNNAASMILADHPMGIGANSFAYVAFTQGYMVRAQVSAGDLEDIAPQVHNAYWLTATETGYLGLVAFVAFLLAPLAASVRTSFGGSDVRHEMIRGIAAALLMVYLHAMFEWIMIATDFQYFLVLNLGMLAGLLQQINRARRDNTAAVIRRGDTNDRPADRLMMSPVRRPLRQQV